MGILGKVVDRRRQSLINTLMVLNVHENKESLLKLSLKELENEYKQILLDFHPHSDMGSIHWTNKKS